MPLSSRTVAPARRVAGVLGAAGVLLMGAAALLQPLPPAPARATPSDPAAGLPCTLHPDGFLRGRIFGALSFTADWSGAGLACDGMPRPDGQSVRLFFAGERPAGGRVSLIIGIDGGLAELVGAERPANVTVIDEREDRFFSTGGPGRCWASIESVTPLPPARGRPAESRIAGVVYCVGALPSLGDRSSLTLGDLHFAGRMTAAAG